MGFWLFWVQPVLPIWNMRREGMISLVMSMYCLWWTLFFCRDFWEISWILNFGIVVSDGPTKWLKHYMVTCLESSEGIRTRHCEKVPLSSPVLLVVRGWHLVWKQNSHECVHGWIGLRLESTLGLNQDSKEKYLVYFYLCRGIYLLAKYVSWFVNWV